MNVGNKILGLAIGQKSILVAEVVKKGEHFAVSHCAEFVFPEGLHLSAPDKLGVAFHQFLRSRHISTKDAVFGLPAKRLVTRRKEVPPASLAVAASTLRLQAEGEFSSELDNLIMDYAGLPSPVETTTVLIVATNKVVVDECEAFARAAGLHALAITSTTAALGLATSRLPGGDGLVLSIGPNGAELVVQHGSYPAHLRHLNVVGGSESISALAGEIRRTMASIPRNGTPQTLALWNSGPAENPQGLLEQRLSMPVTTPEVSSLLTIDTPNTEGFAPVALALAAMEPTGLPVDFLHSRMAAPRAPAMSNPKKLAIAAGVLVVALAAYIYVDLSKRQTEVDQLNATINLRSRAVAQAKDQIVRLEYAKKWLPKGPHNIEVLRDVTQLFPPQGNTIWATSFGNSRDPLSWEIDGRSVNDTYPQTLVDNMGKYPELFNNPRLTLLQKGADNIFQFRLQFTYTPQEGTSPLITAALAAANPATAPNRGGRGGNATGRGATTGRAGGGNNGGGNNGGGNTAGGNNGGGGRAGRGGNTAGG